LLRVVVVQWYSRCCEEQFARIEQITRLRWLIWMRKNRKNVFESL
jgi:hypothetical protein